jgi:hypothetical protein
VTTKSWNDLLNESKGQLDPVPDGEYPVKIIDARDDKSQTQKLMFRVKFQITEGPHQGRKIPNQFVVSDDNPMALAIFFRHMEAMGLDANFFAADPNPSQVADNMLNRECRIVLGTRTWQGVERNDVKGILPPLGGGPVAPGTVTGVATPGGPIAPGAAPTPASTPARPPAQTSDAPPLPF